MECDEVMKRSIYLINPKFQLRFSLFVSSLVFLSSLLYPVTIYELITKVAEKLGGTAAVELNQNKIQLIVVLSIIQFVFMGIVFIVCIFQSHKIAGPIYKIGMFLRNVKDGEPLTSLTLRKGDHFQEIAMEYNGAIDRIKLARKDEYAYLSEVCSYIDNLSLAVPEDKKMVLDEIVNRLEEIQKNFNE